MASVAIIGSGRVGSTLAYSLLYSDAIDKLVLIDIVKDLADGERLDLYHAASGLNRDVEISSSDSVNAAKDSDVVVVTAGFPRKPDMTRMDLLKKNLGIIRDVGEKLKGLSHQPIVIVVTNPIDVLSYFLQKVLEYDWGRVFGFGNSLDTARLKFIVSQRLKVPLTSIEAIVMGQHGEHMVPVFSQLKVRGKPVEIEDKEGVRKELLGSAARVIALKRGTWFGPSACLKELIESVVLDRKEVIPVSIDPKGAYGVSGVHVGVPAVVGKRGVEKVVEVELDELEEKWFKESVEYLRKVICEVEGMEGG